LPIVADAENDATDPALTVIDDGWLVIDGAYCTVNTAAFDVAELTTLVNTARYWYWSMLEVVDGVV